MPTSAQLAERIPLPGRHSPTLPPSPLAETPNPKPLLQKARRDAGRGTDGVASTSLTVKELAILSAVGFEES